MKCLKTVRCEFFWDAGFDLVEGLEGAFSKNVHFQGRRYL